MLLVEEVTSGRIPAGEEEEEEEEEEESVRLWRMLLIVSFRSRSRRTEEEGLRGRRGTCCSFNVSPGGKKTKPE